MNDFATHAALRPRGVGGNVRAHAQLPRCSTVRHWLKPAGCFFMHIFCHRDRPYAFVDRGPSDWMSRFFFTGGMMPSDDLPLHFQSHLQLPQHWRWDGLSTTKDTANAWLDNMDAVVTRYGRVWKVSTAHNTRSSGGCAGACFSWPARNCSATKTGNSGGSAITCLKTGKRRRRASRMNILANAIAFQLGWFACVLGGANQMPWLGTLVAASS